MCCLSVHVIGRAVWYEWFVMKFGVGGFTLKLWGEFYLLHSILSLHFFTLSDFSKMVHYNKKLLHLKFILIWWIFYKITRESNKYLCEMLYCIYTLQLTDLYSHFFFLNLYANQWETQYYTECILTARIQLSIFVCIWLSRIVIYKCHLFFCLILWQEYKAAVSEENVLSEHLVWLRCFFLGESQIKWFW